MRAKKLPLPKAAWERLQPFLYWKEDRQRVILYLIAAGYSVPELVRMTVKELKRLRMHTEIEVARDDAMADNKPDAKAFVFPNGNVIPHTTFYRIVRHAAMKAVGKPLSQDGFREYVHK